MAEPVIKQGYLYKKSPHAHTKGYQKRWFQLTPLWLRYYKMRSRPRKGKVCEKKGEMPVACVLTVRQMVSVASGGSKSKCKFGGSPNANDGEDDTSMLDNKFAVDFGAERRQFLLRAGSVREAREWAVLIDLAARGYRELLLGGGNATSTRSMVPRSLSGGKEHKWWKAKTVAAAAARVPTQVEAAARMTHADQRAYWGRVVAHFARVDEAGIRGCSWEALNLSLCPNRPGFGTGTSAAECADKENDRNGGDSSGEDVDLEDNGRDGGENADDSGAGKHMGKYAPLARGRSGTDADADCFLVERMPPALHSHPVDHTNASDDAADNAGAVVGAGGHDGDEAEFSEVAVGVCASRKVRVATGGGSDAGKAPHGGSRKDSAASLVGAIPLVGMTATLDHHHQQQRQDQQDNHQQDNHQQDNHQQRSDQPPPMRHTSKLSSGGRAPPAAFATTTATTTAVQDEHDRPAGTRQQPQQRLHTLIRSGSVKARQGGTNTTSGGGSGCGCGSENGGVSGQDQRQGQGQLRLLRQLERTATSPRSLDRLRRLQQLRLKAEARTRAQLRIGGGVTRNPVALRHLRHHHHEEQERARARAHMHMDKNEDKDNAAVLEAAALLRSCPHYARNQMQGRGNEHGNLGREQHEVQQRLEEKWRSRRAEKEKEEKQKQKQKQKQVGGGEGKDKDKEAAGMLERGAGGTSASPCASRRGMSQYWGGSGGASSGSGSGGGAGSGGSASRISDKDMEIFRNIRRQSGSSNTMWQPSLPVVAAAANCEVGDGDDDNDGVGAGVPAEGRDSTSSSTGSGGSSDGGGKGPRTSKLGLLFGDRDSFGSSTAAAAADGANTAEGGPAAPAAGGCEAAPSPAIAATATGSGAIAQCSAVGSIRGYVYQDDASRLAAPCLGGGRVMTPMGMGMGGARAARTLPAVANMSAHSVYRVRDGVAVRIPAPTAAPVSRYTRMLMDSGAGGGGSSGSGGAADGGKTEDTSRQGRFFGYTPSYFDGGGEADTRRNTPAQAGP